MKTFTLTGEQRGYTGKVGGWDFENGSLDLSDADGGLAERILCRFHNCKMQVTEDGGGSARLIVVVGFRVNDEQPERATNALHCLRALADQSIERDTYQIILVEEDKKTRCPKELLEYVDQHVFCQSTAAYNRSRAFNTGVEHTKAGGDDLLCLIDADILVDREYLSRLGLHLRNADAVLPYRSALYLHQLATPLVIEGRFGTDPDLAEAARYSGRTWAALGGALWIKASLYKNLGGYDKRFVGWGCEDRDMWHRLNAVTEVERVPRIMYHLWHRRSDPGPEHKVNRKLLKKLHPGMRGRQSNKTGVTVGEKPERPPRREGKLQILWLTINRDHRVARIFQPVMEQIRRREDVTVYCHDRFRWDFSTVMGPNPKPQPPELDVAWVNEFDIVFTDAVFGYLGDDWPAVTAYKCCLIEDCHCEMPERYVRQAYEQFGFDAFFYRYQEGFEKHHSYVDVPTRWLPHSIDPLIFRVGDAHSFTEREHTALSVGVDVQATYPLRFQASRELRGLDGYKRIQRPIENDGNAWPVGEDYANLLRASKIVVSGCSIYHYPILKTFEIPACGAVLACDAIPDLDELGFVPEVNYLPLKKNVPGHIREVIEHWLAEGQRDALETIAKAGTKLILNKHTAAIRAGELSAQLRELLEVKT